MKNQNPFSNELEKVQWREEMKAKYIAELKSSPTVQKLYSEYTPTSVDSFVNSYAHDKVDWIEYGPIHVEQEEIEQLQWVEKAFECLKEIQQKKLFDLQCQWRANKIQLKGVEICQDLIHWEDNILNCPYLSHITEEELDLYLKYMQSNNYQETHIWSFERWQDYDEIKEAYHTDNENRNFPEWYDFYNSRMGTGVYLSFPDIQGEKELFYIRLYGHEYRKQQKELEAIKQAAPITEKRPYINISNKELTQWFVDTFEDHQTREYAELIMDEYSNIDDNHQWNIFMVTIEKITEPIPVEACSDWEEALNRTVDNYKRIKTAEALPLAYDKYCMFINSGIAFECKQSDFEEDLQHTRKYIINEIIQGRILNGEPPDLNY